MNTDKAIWKKFHVHAKDNLPFEGWLESTRETLYELFGELGFTKGAEIGVRMARNSEEMFKRIPNLHLLLIDPWGAYLRVSDERQEAYYKYALARMAPFKDRVTFMKMTSMDAVKQIADESLDFIYVDGRHDYDYVMADLVYWIPKVRKGGIVSGHDFYPFYQGGVIQAVEAYTMANNIKQWYITREKTASWFFVKG